MRITPLITLVLCVSAVAQRTSDTAATALAAKTITAFSQVPVKAVHLSGTARRNSGSTDTTGTFAFDVQADGTSRLHVDVGMVSRTETTSTFSDQAECGWSEPNGRVHKAAGHNCLSSIDWILPAFSVSIRAGVLELMSRSERPFAIEVRRPVSTGTDRYKKRLAGLSLVLLTVDPTTSNPTAIMFNIHPDDDATKDIPVTIQYSDYRQISGVSIPFHIQRFMNGSLVLDFQVESASVQ